MKTKEMAVRTVGGDAESRKRNARALELIRGWRADESGYDEAVFPVLKAEMEADRLADRKRFGA